MVRGGHLIKTARKARGMSQEYVGEAHGVGVKTISRWENSITPIPFDDLIWMVTDIFKITLSEAMELAENENN